MAGAIGERITVPATANGILAVRAGRAAVIKNAGANIIYLGGGPTGLTAANGFALAVGQTIQIDASVDDVWAIVAAATEPLHVLATRPQASH